jgi:single-stranded-DNA-specific exonuclease
MAKYNITLQEKHKIDLTNALKNQLGVTEEILSSWETEKYPVDGQVISHFWGYVKDAPAITIVGDYDCDGICASYIMSTGIKSLFPKKQVKVRIPRRFSEGYGINDIIADEIISTMPAGSLVITVDNGIAAAPVLERIAQSGYKVIITDHHELREGCKLPELDMVIDPAVPSLSNPFVGRYWCGAGVAYKLCEPVILEELAKDLSVFAGLATVADCMELKEGNWGLVRNAIKAFREKKAPKALRSLLAAMGQDPDFCNEEHFGFYLGPAFNAPGRLLDKGAVEVLKYLFHPTPEGCERIVDLNNQRKSIRDTEYEIVKEEITKTGQSKACPIWIAVEGLHEGIVGILAGKVAEEYHRPAIILTNVENNPGMLKGSARSYGEFNIFAYLSSMPEYFSKMGGHKGAAGLSITEENFQLAKKNQIPPGRIEDSLTVSSLNFPIRQWEIPGINEVLLKFRPFGEGNAAPKFEVQVDMEKDGARYIGEKKNHLLIQDKSGRYKLTHFNHVPNELSDADHFGMRGTISGSAFAGVETPSFNAEEVFDLIEEKGERGR